MSCVIASQRYNTSRTYSKQFSYPTLDIRLLKFSEGVPPGLDVGHLFMGALAQQSPVHRAVLYNNLISSQHNSVCVFPVRACGCIYCSNDVKRTIALFDDLHRGVPPLYVST